MKDYEKCLKEIYDDFNNKKANKIIITCNNSVQKANIEFLIENGLVKSTGVENWMNGVTRYYLKPTYIGLHYDEIKDEMNDNQVQNISNIYNNYDGKMNINSVDNSISSSNDFEVFEKMIDVANTIDVQNKEEIIKAIEDMKNSIGKNKYKSSVSDFLEKAANCMTVFSPFIQILMKYT